MIAVYCKRLLPPREIFFLEGVVIIAGHCRRLLPQDIITTPRVQKIDW